MQIYKEIPNKSWTEPVKENIRETWSEISYLEKVIGIPFLCFLAFLFTVL